MNIYVISNKNKEIKLLRNKIKKKKKKNKFQ